MLNVPEYLIVHHTGGTDKDPFLDTSHHTFEIVKQAHLARNFEDIGYHYFIEKDGALKAGRAENYHGAHTLGYNTKSLGICLAGNFDQKLPTPEQQRTLSKLLGDLCGKYNIPRENIVPHRTFANKTCYGNRLTDEWAAKLVPEDTRKQQMLAKLKECEELFNKLYN